MALGAASVETAMRIAVCDADPREGQKIRSLTEDILEAKGIETVVEYYGTTAELMAAVRDKGFFDFYLMETEIGGASGMEIARWLRTAGDNAPLVFVTSDATHAIDGYKVAASDYLLKPMTADILGEALARILRVRRTVLFRTTRGQLKPVEVGNIIWAEAFVHHTELHTERGAWTIRGILSEVVGALHDPRFWRCHRSYMINLDHVTDVDKTSVTMADGSHLPISRGSMREIQEALAARLSHK
ncbi:MAG: response regulator transcription factor [Lachnospiraceae bacterium]|nr:response regulator transcription factor [Lachnospiraceae bacterium]